MKHEPDETSTNYFHQKWDKMNFLFEFLSHHDELHHMTSQSESEAKATAKQEQFLHSICSAITLTICHLSLTHDYYRCLIRRWGAPGASGVGSHLCLLSLSGSVTLPLLISKHYLPWVAFKFYGHYAVIVVQLKCVSFLTSLPRIRLTFCPGIQYKLNRV